MGEKPLQTAEKGEAHPWDRGPRRPVRGPMWAADTAKPLLSRMCSFPGGQRGPLASLWLPHLTLAAPSDSGPDTCFLPVLASGFFRSFYPLQEQEAWQKLVGGLPEYFIELDRKALASCIPGTT